MAFAGVYAIGRNKRAGFLICAFGEILWCVKSIVTEQPDLLLLCVVFAVLHFCNWKGWVVDGQHKIA